MAAPILIKRKTKLFTYSPEVLEKLKQKGHRSKTGTIQQLFPELLNDDGNDLSLMSSAKWEIMVTYAKARKYLIKNVVWLLFLKGQIS